jgi:hypothetical protein
MAKRNVDILVKGIIWYWAHDMKDLRKVHQQLSDYDIDLDYPQERRYTSLSLVVKVERYTQAHRMVEGFLDMVDTKGSVRNLCPELKPASSTPSITYSTLCTFKSIRFRSLFSAEVCCDRNSCDCYRNWLGDFGSNKLAMQELTA